MPDSLRLKKLRGQEVQIEDKSPENMSMENHGKTQCF